MSDKLLDTTVLIDLVRGSEAAADFIDAARQQEVRLCVSVISAMEMIAGCRNQNEVHQMGKLFADFTLLHLTPDVSAQAYDLMSQYSKSHGLTIPDALIAATALTEGLDLVSDNERHFRMIPDLAVQRAY